MKKGFLFSALLPLLSGCTTIGNWADDLGSHMPVLGERCDHWQCFTSSGQAQSDYNRQTRERQEGQPQDPSQYPEHTYPDYPSQ